MTTVHYGIDKLSKILITLFSKQS